MNLSACDICPRMCGADREHGKLGFCGAGRDVRIALVSLHQWEEPCLTGDRGAGTVFFSHCNMKCVFCQNWSVSHEGQGISVSTERLAEIFLEQQERGAATLDLVTPTHYVPQIIEALDMAAERGFLLPVVYNSGGYEMTSTMESLRGYVDVFLPDLKYFDDSLAVRYSNAPGYFHYASEAIKKMYEITGPFVMENGRMTHGVIVRHMVLPSHYRDSFKVLDFLHGEFGDGIFVSLMNQFTPYGRTAEFKEINRRLTTLEYNKVLDYAEKIGMTNCFVQYGKTAMEKFIPVFDGSNVEKKL